MLLALNSLCSTFLADVHCRSARKPCATAWQSVTLSQDADSNNYIQYSMVHCSAGCMWGRIVTPPLTTELRSVNDLKYGNSRAGHTHMHALLWQSSQQPVAAGAGATPTPMADPIRVAVTCAGTEPLA
jgi:hypothetical protein